MKLTKEQLKQIIQEEMNNAILEAVSREELQTILGGGNNPNDRVMKKAYRNLARKYHPDLDPDDPERTDDMKKIQKAYFQGILPPKEPKRKAPEMDPRAIKHFNDLIKYIKKYPGDEACRNFSHTINSIVQYLVMQNQLFNQKAYVDAVQDFLDKSINYSTNTHDLLLKSLRRVLSGFKSSTKVMQHKDEILKFIDALGPLLKVPNMCFLAPSHIASWKALHDKGTRWKPR